MAVDRNAVIKEAQKLAGKGQFDKAIAEWRKLVKDTPHDANIFNTIGDLCLKKNSKTEAVDAYRRAADILAEDGFTSKAIALYKKVLNIDPNQVEVHLKLGDMHAEKGLTGNALENYKVVTEYYTKLNKKAEALSIYQKMADLNPANISFRVKLAGMYTKEGMTAEAVKAYLDAADQHIAKEAFQDARQLFEKVLAADPENKAVYHKAGIVYFKEGKFDEARKSLKRAFEANPDNDELRDLYLEVLDKAGRSGDAEDVYRKLLSLDPSRADLHEKLYHISIAKKDYDKALVEAMFLAEQKIEAMDFAGAAEVLRGLIIVTHDPLQAAAALGDLFGKHGRARDGANELLTAAGALIERGSTDDAREVLNRALILSPGFSEAIEKLEGLGRGAAKAPTAAPKAPAARQAAPAEQELGSPVEELGAPLDELTVPTLEVEPPRPEAPAGPAEDPAVAGALSEVDVLTKYGLTAKAVEQLEGLVRKFPEAPSVRSRLLDLYRDQKKTDKAVLQALMLAELYEQRGQEAESRAVLGSALELAPGNAQIMAKLGMAPAEAEEPEAVETIEEPEAIETLSDEVEELPELPVPELDLEELAVPEEVEEIPLPRRARGRVVVPEPEEAEEVSFEPEPDFEEAVPVQEPLAGGDVAEVWAEAEFYYQQGLFDEARKHYERVLELKPGDRRAMERIVELTREKEDIQELTRLAEAVESLESIVEAGPGAAEEVVTQSDVDSVRSLMDQITDMRKEKRPSPRPPARPAPPPPPTARGEAEESFAGIMDDMAGEPAPGPAARRGAARPAPDEDEEMSFADLDEEMSGAAPAAPPKKAAEPAASDEAGDFFDLAAELRDELSATTEPKSTTAHEQSLDEIFEEFKAGVEAHEKKEDEDTHYNLGVAYREMGLLDDAISEFNMTNEGEPKFILSRYMLGLCYLENGDFETAITEIQNALGYSYSFGEASEERLGMHYDLGLAYQGVGNNTSALEEFQKVRNLDPSYREVASKLKDLQEGEYISLDAIKEDIEKEISFKFLEEGARIEREEKTRKSKK